MSSSLVNRTYLYTSPTSLDLHKARRCCPLSRFKQMPGDCSLQQSEVILSSFLMLCIPKDLFKHPPVCISPHCFADECISLPLACLHQAYFIEEISKSLEAVKALHSHEAYGSAYFALLKFPQNRFSLMAFSQALFLPMCNSHPSSLYEHQHLRFHWDMPD